MDPNAALAEFRELDGHALDEQDALRCVELFRALDGWLAGGGFLPRSWARGQVAEDPRVDAARGVLGRALPNGCVNADDLAEALGEVTAPAHSVTLVFATAEEMLDCVDYLGDEDAPVFLNENGETVPIRVGSTARVSGAEFALWGEFQAARMALIAEREAAENV